MNQQRFSIAIGVSDDTVSNWYRRKSESYFKYLSKIAEVLDTSTEYLLTGKEANKNGPTIVSDDEAALDEELVSRLCRLTPEECVKVDAFVQGLLAAREADASPKGSDP